MDNVNVTPETYTAASAAARAAYDATYNEVYFAHRAGGDPDHCAAAAAHGAAVAAFGAKSRLKEV